MTFANAIISPLLKLLEEKKYYTPFPLNEIERMIDNVFFMPATQFWESFHINRIYDYYNTGFPGFLIKFRGFAGSESGVRQVWKALWLLQTTHGAGFGKYFYFLLYFIHFLDTKMNFKNDGICCPAMKRPDLRQSVSLFAKMRFCLKMSS